MTGVFKRLLSHASWAIVCNDGWGIYTDDGHFLFTLTGEGLKEELEVRQRRTNDRYEDNFVSVNGRAFIFLLVATRGMKWVQRRGEGFDKRREIVENG